MRDYNIEQKLKMMEAHLDELMANYSTPLKDKYNSDDPKDYKEIERAITGFTKLIAAMDKFYSFKVKYEKLSLALEKEKAKLEKREFVKEAAIEKTPTSMEIINKEPDEAFIHAKMQNLSGSDKIMNVEFYEKVKKKHPKAIYDLKKRMIAVYKMQGIQKRRQDITHEECEAVADFYLQNIKTSEYKSSFQTV